MYFRVSRQKQTTTYLICIEFPIDVVIIGNEQPIVGHGEAIVRPEYLIETELPHIFWPRILGMG